MIIGAAGQALSGLDGLHRLLTRWPSGIVLSLEALRGRRIIYRGVVPTVADPRTS
jgi:hypothetical protein